MARAGKLGLLKVSGTPAAYSNEACTDLGTPGVRQYFQVTNAARRIIDPLVAPVVQKDIGAGYVTAAVTEYTLNRLNGKITFLAQLAVPGTVRISTGNYVPVSTVAEAKGWKISLKGINPPPNKFGDVFVNRPTQIQKDVSGSLSAWRTTDDTLRAALEAGNLIVVELYGDSTGAYDFRAFALLTEDTISSMHDGFATDDLAWEGSVVDGVGVAFD